MNVIAFIKARGLHRTSAEIALDLIYAATGMEIPADRITMGIPSAVDPRPDIPYDHNTFVPTSMLDSFDARFLGKEGFLYHRIPLSLLVPNESVMFVDSLTYPVQTHELLDAINKILNAQLTRQDLVNDTYTAPGPLRLRAAPESLVWLGETQVTYRDGLVGGRILQNGIVRITESGAIRWMEKQPY